MVSECGTHFPLSGPLSAITVPGPQNPLKTMSLIYILQCFFLLSFEANLLEANLLEANSRCMIKKAVIGRKKRLKELILFESVNLRQTGSFCANVTKCCNQRYTQTNGWEFK